MKKTKIGILFAGISLLFASCQQLQDSLSSEMQAKLEEETGTASIASKIWYYNGTASEDMSDNTLGQTLLVNFGKKIALGKLSGSIELHYTNSAGNPVTETFSSVSGTFSDDLKGYRVNLSNVLSYFDTEKIPGGTALINLKLGGFICAEGSQNGRPISSFEAKNIQIKPLYRSYSVDYSTFGFGPASRIEYDLNGKVSLANGKYTLTGKGSDSKDYEFEVSAEENKVVLSPKFRTAPGDGVSVAIVLKDLLTETSGNAFSKEITLTFSKYRIVIDGKYDLNYEAGDAVCHEDSMEDQNAFAELGYDIGNFCDIHKVSITNDDDYLYVGVSGNLNIQWGDTLSVLVSNGKVTGGNGAKPDVFCASTEDFSQKPGSRSKIQPNVYISHQPGLNNTGEGALSAAAYVSSVNTDISSAVRYAPAGWTESTYGNFVEYAIPLAQSGLSSGDEISIIVAASLHWDDGNAVIDCAKNDSIVYSDKNHTSVKYDFSNGISYKIQ